MKGLGGTAIWGDRGIIFHERIGAHEITVFKANNTSEFIGWVDEFLRLSGLEHEATYSEQLLELVEDYLARGFQYFVFDLIDVSAETGSVEPIAYEFATSFLYYPLKVSSIAQGEVAITIFLLTEGMVNLDSLPPELGVARFFSGDPVQFQLTEEELAKIETRIAELLEGSTWLTASTYQGVLQSLSHDLEITQEDLGTLDFTLTISPQSGRVTPGILVETQVATVNVTSRVGFNAPVVLAVSSPSTDISARLDPSTVAPPFGGSASSKLLVSTSYTLRSGTYVLTVTGVSGSASSSVQYTLNVVGSPCLIATATYGSELAPEVQFLREFRDREVMRTLAGREFMTVFNAWYYSFSPGIAKIIAGNSLIQGIVRILLYPLIGMLYLSAATYFVFSFSPELAVVTAGLVASALIGIVYFSSFVMVILVLLRRRNKLASAIRFKWFPAIFMLCLTLIVAGEILSMPNLLMLGTSALVLVTLSISALAVGTRTLQMLKH
jgi:hypothetical protein